MIDAHNTAAVLAEIREWVLPDGEPLFLVEVHAVVRSSTQHCRDLESCLQRVAPLRQKLERFIAHCWRRARGAAPAPERVGSCSAVRWCCSCTCPAPKTRSSGMDVSRPATGLNSRTGRHKTTT